MPGVQFVNEFWLMSKYFAIKYLIISITFCLCSSSAFSQDNLSSCLYAVTRGENSTPVVACGNDDPLDLGNNENILNILAQYDIDPRNVRFRGCHNMYFSADHDQATNYPDRYVITYPSNSSEDITSAITHEIVHVFQMKNNDGLEGLRKVYESRQIELEADYLTGVASSKNLTTEKLKLFQHSLSLIGAYIELDSDAHGTPEQRMSAFRVGAFSYEFPDTRFSDMHTASIHFHANVYGMIVHDF